jgi:hypothetical protein
MPTLTKFQCYSCGQTLQVDSAQGGKKAPCPKCGTALTVPVSSGEPAPPPAPVPAEVPAVVPAAAPSTMAAPTAVPQVTAVAAAPVVTRAVDDDLPEAVPQPGGKKKKAKQGPNWLMTRVGLLVIFIGLCIVCLVVLFDQVGNLLHMIQEIRIINAYVDGRFTDERPGDAWKTLLKISGIMFLVVVIVSYVGNILSLFGPRSGGVIAAAVAALVLGALAWLIVLLFHLLPLFGTEIVKYESSIRVDGTTKADFERAESQARGRQVVLNLCYHTLPRLFVSLMFLTSAAAVLVLARHTGSRKAAMMCGAAIGLFLLFILPGVIPPIVASIKFEDIKTVRTMLYVFWIFYWLGFFAEFIGLALTATAAFLARMAAR